MKRTAVKKTLWHPRRGMALYALTILTALFVSILITAGLSVSRLQLGIMQRQSDLIQARANARSAIEVALLAIASNDDWRDNYEHNKETTPVSLGTGLGSISWIIRDEDGRLDNIDTRLTLTGIGRLGHVRQTCTTEFVPGKIEGPANVASQENTSKVNHEEIKNNHWIGQAMLPLFDSHVVEWKVTSVEVFANKKNGNRNMTVKISTANGSHFPANVIDQTSINSNDFSSQDRWTTIAFSGSTWLQPDAEICVTFETSENKSPIELSTIEDTLNASQIALIEGDPTWKVSTPSQSLAIRINACYRTDEAGASVVERTWTFEALP